MGGNDGQNCQQEDRTETRSSPKLPAPPEPENDKGIFPSIKSPALEGLEGITAETVDIFTLEAVAALKLLCRSVDDLVQITGDIPPPSGAEQRQFSSERVFEAS